MPDITTGPNPTIEQIVIGQLLAFHAILDRQLQMIATADDGREFAVLEKDQAMELRGLLGAIAAAMTRQKDKAT